jgi:hypothetical protein
MGNNIRSAGSAVGSGAGSAAGAAVGGVTGTLWSFLTSTISTAFGLDENQVDIWLKMIIISIVALILYVVIRGLIY